MSQRRGTAHPQNHRIFCRPGGGIASGSSWSCGFGGCFFRLVSFEGTSVTIFFDKGKTSTNSDVGMVDNRGNDYQCIRLFARKGSNKITASDTARRKKYNGAILTAAHSTLAYFFLSGDQNPISATAGFWHRSAGKMANSPPSAAGSHCPGYPSNTLDHTCREMPYLPLAHFFFASP